VSAVCNPATYHADFKHYLFSQGASVLTQFWDEIGGRMVVMRVFAFVFVLLGFAGHAGAAERHFQSPSGNIRCVLTDGNGQFARCDLEVDRQSFPDKPASCDGEWGQSFIVGRTGMGFPNCVINAIEGPASPLVLPYGAVAVFEGITCRSETTGVTCTNAEGGGFSVRRSVQRVF